MEATRDWIGDIASALTIASFVGSLSISWRIGRARSSADVAFSRLSLWASWSHSSGCFTAATLATPE
ncbi:hypothetical protein MTO96_033649 [Rhipicephalus appendiculatus]